MVRIAIARRPVSLRSSVRLELEKHARAVGSSKIERKVVVQL